ncbi:MAG TPA: protein kinase [Candidatus Eisenbacteria bacterium]|nr:protein kinase [Candidatus Eisenbacteria bacterium]
MIGTRLAHYLIQEEIGAGGMGVVYRARDERLERDVAVKVLPPGILDDSARARFRREAIALSRLNHPHIGMIHDVGTESGTDFLVMELVRGRTLRERLREGPLPLEEAVETAIAVAEALEEAHEQGVVHRDLKPENILVTAKGWVKVLDFGLASLRPAPGTTVTTQTLTAAHLLTGTLPYMAPEQLLGKPAEARTDLYALGVLLYELATGTRPFEADVQAALIGEILHKTAAAPSSRRAGIPIWFDGIVARCLQKETARRFEDAASLKHALKAGLREGSGSGAGRASLAAEAGGAAPGVTTPPASSGAGLRTPPVPPPTPRSGYAAGGATQNVNPEAYDAVLRGRAIIGRRTEESSRRGIEYFRRAIELDPLYPPAYAGLATVYDLMGFFGMAAPDDCFPRARVAASRSIELDPAWAPGYTALAYEVLYYEWDFRRAEDLFRQAIELDPQYSIAPLWYANLLVFERRFEEANTYVARAQALDPLSSIATMSLGWVAMFQKNAEVALREYQKASHFDPDFHVAHWMSSWCLSALGRHDEAIEQAAKAIDVSKGLLICYPTLARAQALAGRMDEARRVLADLESKSPPRFVEPLEVALVYEALGERDTAFAWLDRALEARSHWLVALAVEPRFDSLRDDPRYSTLMKKVGAFG